MPTAIGWRSPRLWPVIGGNEVGPGVAMDTGVNMERLVPDIRDMLGIIPKA